MGLSQRQRQHQGTKTDKVGRDGGREEKEGDRCRGHERQPQSAQNHRPGPSPQRSWEKRRGRETRRGNRQREGTSQAKHTERFNRQSPGRASQSTDLWGEVGLGPGLGRLFSFSPPRSRYQAPRGCSELWAERSQRRGSWGYKQGSGSNPHIPTSLTGEGRGKKAHGPWHLGTSASLPPLPAKAHMGVSPAPLGQVPHPAHSASWAAPAGVRQGWEQLWASERDGQGAKTCPGQSSTGLFSLAGGGHSSLHGPGGQSQD